MEQKRQTHPTAVIGAILLGALLIVGCGEKEPSILIPETKPMPYEEAAVRADEIVDAWIKGDHATFESAFVPRGNPKHTAEGLAQNWATKVEFHGAFIRRGEPRPAEMKFEEFTAVEIDLEFEKATITLKLIFLENGQLDDCWFSKKET